MLYKHIMTNFDDNNNVGHASESDVTRENLSAVQRIVSSVAGLDTTQYKDDFVCRQIIKRVIRLGMDVGQYIEYLRAEKQEVYLLLDNLTVNHTSFFRDINKYNIFRKIIIPELLLAKGRVK